MRNIAIIFLFFFTATYSVDAQHFIFSENCKNAYQKITTLEFEKGKQLLEAERKQNPTNVMPVLLENYFDFLRVIIGEQEQDYELFKDMKRQRFRAIRSGDKNSPYYLYALANLNLHYAFARIRFKDYFTALFEIKRAFHLLERNIEKHPDFPPNYIGSGLLHTMVGSIPNNYKWVSWLASMDGTVDQGFNELFMVLEEAQNNFEYAHLLNETAFFLTFLEMNISSDQANAEKLLSTLNKETNVQPLIVFAKLSILKKMAHTEEAIKILDEYQPSETSYPFHYLTYLRGLFNLNRLDESANIYFQKYLNEFKGGSYVKSSYQKMAWLALIEGDENKYKQLILFCKTEGNDNLDGDKQAQREAEKNQIPQSDLLKARLLYDGGYYSRSLNILNDSKLIISDFNQTELAEYYYRLARNYQGIRKFKEAILYFKKAIKIGHNLSDYYAGNSALQLGLIYENQQDYNRSKAYYETCLDLDFKTYKKSLDVKAKAGLSRLETKKGAE